MKEGHYIYFCEYTLVYFILVFLTSRISEYLFDMKPVESRGKRILSYFLSVFILVVPNLLKVLGISTVSGLGIVHGLFYTFFSRLPLAMYFGRFKPAFIYLSLFTDAAYTVFSFLGLHWRSIESASQTDMIIYITVSQIPHILLLLFILSKVKKRPKNVAEAVRLVPKRIYIILLVIFYTFVFLVLVFSAFITEDFFRSNLNAAQKALLWVVFALLMADLILFIYVGVTLMKIAVSDKRRSGVNAILEKQLNDQLNHYEHINDIYKEFRAFRHDMKNHLLCVKGYLSQQRYDEALEYMQQLTDRSYTETNSYDTGNFIADALLSDKAVRASDSGTSIVFSGRIPPEGIDAADLCTFFGNALDNAIEACAKDSSGSSKTIDVNCSVDRGCFFVKIVNPYFEKLHITGSNSADTTKSDRFSHGFGVSNIVRTAEKYSGSVDISADNGVFTLSADMVV